MEKDVILAAGASGDQAERLISLLRAAGYDTTDDTTLTPGVMAAVARAQADLGVVEPGSFSPAEAGLTIKGSLVGQATWDALRNAAAAKTGLYLAAPAYAQAAVDAANQPAEEEAAATKQPAADAAPADAPAGGPSKEAQPAGGGWGT